MVLLILIPKLIPQKNMSTPIYKLIYDRRRRASNTHEGSIELRITFNSIQKFVTSGVRVYPNQWKDERIVNRFDASELQNSLDYFVLQTRKIVNDLLTQGTLDMNTLVSDINNKLSRQASVNVPETRLLLDYMKERTAIRKFGRKQDTQERYDRFLRWFEKWGGMVTLSDLTEMNILRMDAALGDMQPYSKWHNYHRFLNSFILDAIDDGLMKRNPYKSIHIDKEPTKDALEKYLTKEEFERIAGLSLPINYLQHAQDLFIFQTYTCLAYTDLADFNPDNIKYINERPVYVGRRAKTGQPFTFLLLQPAMDILKKYNNQLPIMTNQKYNSYIKMLAVMAGIEKPVSSHWARHTGATLLLNSGVDMEIVSKVLGHASTTMTRNVYAKLLDETVADAMAKVRI